MITWQFHLIKQIPQEKPLLVTLQTVSLWYIYILLYGIQQQQQQIKRKMRVQFYDCQCFCSNANIFDRGSLALALLYAFQMKYPVRSVAYIPLPHTKCTGLYLSMYMNGIWSAFHFTLAVLCFTSMFSLELRFVEFPRGFRPHFFHKVYTEMKADDKTLKMMNRFRAINCIKHSMVLAP